MNNYDIFWWCFCLFLIFLIFKLGVTSSKAEQPLKGMELQEKEAQKD